MRRSRRAPVLPVLAPALLVALLAAVAGGLLRAGVPLPPAGDWPGQAAVHHGALMVGAFMGTLVAVERAVALRVGWAWIGPVLSAAAGLLLLAGHAAAPWLLVAAGAAFVAVNVRVVRLQRAPHTALLLAGAACWLAGNGLFAAHAGGASVLPWWFAFLLLTVTAERLEMTRLMRRRRGASFLLAGVLAALLGGAAVSVWRPLAGGLLYGAALVGLSAWLLLFDVARRTVRVAGLPRYMACCLLAGHAWLGVGGFAWATAAAGLPARDAALHALGLGFIASMVFGHAPVILPAVAGVKLQFGRAFYLPLALLHGSLLVRVCAPVAGARWQAVGAAGNALALAAFAATAVAAAWTWKRRHPAVPQPG